MEHLLNKIHHMDCMDLLAQLPDASIDMVLCDLPYGVTACKWDTIIPIEPMWEQLKRIVKPRSAIVLTATQPFSSRLVSSNYEMFRQSLVWKKSVSTGFLDAKRKHLPIHEDILIFGNKAPNYYPVMKKGKPFKVKKKSNATSDIYNQFTLIDELNNGTRFPNSIIEIENLNFKGKLHPTQKPVALFEYLIKTYTLENEIVLDMTCGSGTTAIASRNLNRQFICGDYHLPYVEIARTRLQNSDPYQATVNKDGSKQLSLFEGL